MPRIKSAKKRMRQSEKRNEQNRAQRSKLRSAVRRVRAAGSADEAATAYTDAAKLLDRAGRKNLIHPNVAARTKSRLTKAVAAKAAPAS